MGEAVESGNVGRCEGEGREAKRGAGSREKGGRRTRLRRGYGVAGAEAGSQGNLKMAGFLVRKRFSGESNCSM